MTDFKYIPIKEFAEEVGLSKQAIYQRLERDLKPYVKVENGFKSISTEALLLFCDKPINCEVENDLKVETKENTDVVLIKEWFQFNVQFFKEQVESKDKQIAEKDKQIAELMRLLAEKNKPKKGLFARIFGKGE